MQLDEERQLRDLAYPIIEPPLSRPAWKSVFGDYKALPSPWQQKVVFDRTMYGRTLIDEPHRSHSSRYAQLIEDVRNDTTRFEPFFASAIRVIDLDRKRDASMARVSALSPREKADAVARMQENSLIIQWVQQSLEQRDTKKTAERKPAAKARSTPAARSEAEKKRKTGTRR